MTGSIVYFGRSYEDVQSSLSSIGLECFAGKPVPVKLHMGEPGNPYFVQPSLVRVLVTAVKEAGGRPFLFDTVVAYPGERSHRRGYERVAYRHGFTPDAVGCNVAIGERGVRVVEADVALEVATQLYECDCMVVLSHVKGHIQAGFGGAIKNLGMGGVTKASKRRIHYMSVPVHDAALCTNCGLCVAACPSQALTTDGGWRIDRSRCEGCGKCVTACQQGAMRFEIMSLARGLAISALACTRGKKVVYVNSLHNIAASCDCDPSPGELICPDIGYVIGTDAAAVDSASLDLIDQVSPDVLLRATGVDPREQVRHAIALGMCGDYTLIDAQKAAGPREG
ncbi:MAG: DUF362 domain-containing protein [Dehalococcoidia bacterium]|nr:DUF362 domain-containing protein [Dehalococcoidia bacterium]